MGSYHCTEQQRQVSDTVLKRPAYLPVGNPLARSKPDGQPRPWRRSTIKETLIPRAVAWYTGAAVQGDDEDDDDEYDEEEGDDDEDEEDEVRACSCCAHEGPRLRTRRAKTKCSFKLCLIYVLVEQR